MAMFSMFSLLRFSLFGNAVFDAGFALAVLLKRAPLENIFRLPLGTVNLQSESDSTKRSIGDTVLVRVVR